MKKIRPAKTIVPHIVYLILTFPLLSTDMIRSGDPANDEIPEKERATLPELYFHVLKDTTLRYELFESAYTGFRFMQQQQMLKKNILTIIDYSLSANQKRLWILDMDSIKVVYHGLVAHGRQSGEEYAKRFSNVPGSYMSSMGFFLTGSTYYGKHGLSLHIDGIEKGINDKARDRSIVIHSADYVSEDFIRRYGRLGRSLGCPAVSLERFEEIIHTISQKSCLYINGKSSDYLNKSKIFKWGAAHIRNPSDLSLQSPVPGVIDPVSKE